MKRTLGAASLALLTLPALAIRPQHPAPLYVEGQVIVKYRSNASPDTIRSLKTRMAIRTLRTLGRPGSELLQLPSTMDVASAMRTLATDPTVDSVQPNYLKRARSVLPNDTYFTSQWGLDNTGQANFVSGGPAGLPGGDLDLLPLWDPSGNGSFPQTGLGSTEVAVIDDGFQTNHPDLAANFQAGVSFNDDGSTSADVSPVDDHGTEVAGALGAQGGNSTGVAGAIWHVRMLPLKFNFDTATEVAALQYADQHGVKLINGSYGGPLYDPAEQAEFAQLQADGVLFFNAAGNESTNTDIAGANYPIGYGFDNVVGVAATNRQDNIASFSTYGPVTVPVAAPGLQIVTTMTNSGYSTNGVDGTSFSSPYAAGVAALLNDYATQPDASSIRARLIESASAGIDSTTPVKDNQLVAGGRIDAAAALAMTPIPSLTLAPVQIGSFSQANPDSSNGSAITVPILGAAIINGNTSGGGVLEPGQNATLQLTLKDDWVDATGVTGTLSADNGVTITSGAVNFGNLAAGQSAHGSFTVSVPGGLSGDHAYIHFSLRLTANELPRPVTRNFILEVGTLQDSAITNTTVQQVYGTNLYDNYHTWHITLNSIPNGANTLTFEAGAANDVDILVSEDSPPQYSIDLDAYSSNGQYFYNLPDAQTGAGFGPGYVEYVNMPITTADIGHTFYVTVINYDLSGATTNTLQQSYQLEAFTNVGGVGGYPSSTIEAQQQSSSGGGAFGLEDLAGLGLLVALGRRKRGKVN